MLRKPTLRIAKPLAAIPSNKTVPEFKNNHNMNKYFLLTIYIITSTFCFSAEQEQIFMKTSEINKISICIAGSGNIVIDWGDGTAKETHILSINNNTEELFTDVTFFSSPFHYKHIYSDTTSREIIITGGTITHLKTVFIPLTSLDVRKSINLIQLFCGGNSLTSMDLSRNTKLTHLATNATRLTNLDISNNPSLIYLNCVGNRLENLDVSNNTKLIQLLLYNNLLTSLDVSKNIKLERLTISYNRFYPSDINNLFETLHDNITQGEKNIDIVGNTGTSESNQNIASEKDWIVTKKW